MSTHTTSPVSKAKSKEGSPNLEEARRAFENGIYPYKTKIGKRDYEAQKAALHAELLKVQHWAQETGEKIVMLFEGRDAAGKGGTIKRFTEHLNPRFARVIALKNQQTKSAANGISSAMCSTCPPAARSCSMTAAGIIAQVSRGSWAFVSQTNTSNLCVRPLM